MSVAGIFVEAARAVARMRVYSKASRRRQSLRFDKLYWKHIDAARCVFWNFYGDAHDQAWGSQNHHIVALLFAAAVISDVNREFKE